MNRRTVTAVRSRGGVLLSLALVAACAQVQATELDWKNMAGVTDFNAAASYTQATTAPSSTTVEFFKATEVSNPSLTATLTTAGLNFSASGYDFTGVAGKTLTLAGYGTGATGTTASAAAAIYSSATGTNTIEVPITLASGNGTAIPTIIVTGVGGNTILSGKLSGTLGFTTTITGGSTLTLSGTSDISGTISLASAALSGGAATLAIGNDSALGTATLAFTSGDTLTAVGAAHTVNNTVTLGGDAIVAGSNDFTLSGTLTSSGSGSRKFIANNSGVTTLSGNVFLSDVAGTARGIAFGGSGALNITGVVADFNGTATLGQKLTYNGSNTLTLSGNNTYTGATSISGGGTLKAAAATGKALGTTSGVTVSGGGTLLFGASNQLNANTPAAVTLGTSASTAATIKVGGFNQGSTSGAGVGALTLFSGSTGNTLDFGGAAGIISFSTFTPNSAVLTISNYVGNGSSGGSDELIFKEDESTKFGNFDFGSGAGVNVNQADLGNGFYEVYYTLSTVPEPTTVFGAALLIGVTGWNQRRRVLKAARTRRPGDVRGV